MKQQYDVRSRLGRWSLIIGAAAVLVACGGGRDPILGIPSITGKAPTILGVVPAPNAVGVPSNTASVTATISEAVAPIAGDASFTLTCAAPCVNPTGTVSLDATNTVASFTLTPGTTLSTLSLYTATITGVTSVATGLKLATPYTWQFTTGTVPVPDTTRPQVIATVPVTTVPGPTPNTPLNSAISATFSEDMATATINQGSFTLTCTLPCVAPAGLVTYANSSRTATFVPSPILQPNTTYTATIKATVTDLAGNALAGNQAPLIGPSDYVWQFTTTASPVVPVAQPIVNTSLNPLNTAINVCPAASINASFSVPGNLRLNPATVNGTTFTVTGPTPTTPVVAKSISLDAATGSIATFIPATPLIAGVTYTATVKGGVAGITDNAIPPNTLASDLVWSFTAGPATGKCLAPVPLNTVSTFGTFGGSAGMTNMGLLTVINGDIGTTAVSTKVTGFLDAGPGCTYTVTGSNAGFVNGTIYTAAPPPTPACPQEGNATTFAKATQANADALIAYNALVALPAGSDPGAGSLSGLTLAPGVYTSASGSFRIQGSDLTLDGQGDPNAVFVFQMASTLTVGGPGAAFPRNIILINGAQAKNVFWQVGSAATINAGGGGTMVGTIIAQAGVTFSTAGQVAIVTLNGRALSLGASVTMVNTVINVPAP